MLKTILGYFKTEQTVYAHRNRTIEVIALEKGIDINSIRDDNKAIMKKEGRVEAVVNLRRRFHVTTSAAWVFVDKLDLK